MSHVEPFGEDRADLRAAVMTANQMCSQMTEAIDEVAFRDLVRGLADYMGVTKQDDHVDLDALERVKQQNGRNR